MNERPAWLREPMDDAEMAARAAWLHYAGGLTQSAIAERFGIPVTRAHRMIARAARDGLVRVFVDARVSGCVTLEDRLTALFDLRACVVAPDLGEAASDADGAPGSMPLRALGLAAANLMMRILDRREDAVIGVGHGSTLAAMVETLPGRDAGGARFVSLLGGLTRKFAANPYDVIHKLAEKTGAEAFLTPAPLFANTPADRATLMAQPGMAEIARLWDAAQVCLLGIGAVDMAGSIARANVFDPENSLRELRERGARAEVLGQFLDADGRLMATPYDGRVMAPALSSLKGREVHAIAGGPTKARALDAALRSGVFSGLITDEATARRLVALAEARDAAPASPGGL
ncbi:MAG: sugar-binding transcriptional regulator [Rubrimonas sp.]